MYEKNKTERPAVQCSAYVWQFNVEQLKTKEHNLFTSLWDKMLNLDDEEMASTKDNG